MYTDFNSENSEIQKPSEIIGETAARDCVRLASDCLEFACKRVSDTEPKGSTCAEDQVFTMKNGDVRKIIESEDFWAYYIAQLKSGKVELMKAALQYRTKYLLKGVYSVQFGSARKRE